MKLGRILIVAGLVAALALLAPGPQARAGNPPSGAPTYNESAGEVWGTLVINCGSP